jgi:hypothetical protein
VFENICVADTESINEDKYFWAAKRRPRKRFLRVLHHRKKRFFNAIEEERRQRLGKNGKRGIYHPKNIFLA